MMTPVIVTSVGPPFLSRLKYVNNNNIRIDVNICTDIYGPRRTGGFWCNSYANVCVEGVNCLKKEKKLNVNGFQFVY